MKGMEAIKGFKEKFGKPSKELLDRHKHNTKSITAIKKALVDGPLNVPQAAEKTGISKDEVFWYMNALKKYGDVVIIEKEDGFNKYGLKEENNG